MTHIRRLHRLGEEIVVTIRGLERFAHQNDADAQAGEYTSSSCAQARAVASEQRRMIQVLRKLLKYLR